MKPFSIYFGGASRQSMEPLLKEKTKEEGLSPYSRSSSPSSVDSSEPHWKPGFSLRRHRLLAVTVTLLGVVSLLASFHAYTAYTIHEPQIFNITLDAEVQPFVAPKNGQKVFEWRREPFLPDSPSALKKAKQRLQSLVGIDGVAPATVHQTHQIPLHPKVASLDDLPDHVRTDEIVFGFTSPYRRAREMCKTWKHFLQHGSHCLIVLPKEEIVYKKDMEFYLRKEGLQCKVETVDLGQYERYEHRVMDLPRRMVMQNWHNKEGNKVEPKWFVVADDDTQILDMRLLQREMSSRTHQEDHMLCAVTESQQQLGRHGRICYGGGGIVMSASLANKMANRLGECLWWHHWRFGGDEMITHCASTASATEKGGTPPDKLFEEVVGLHQIDIPGDGSGVFQSGLPFISLHHYTGWLEIFPLWFAPDRFDALRRLQKAANFLGGDNLFKRYVFDDGHTMVSLGYSITLYSQPLKQYEMQLMERTYRSWEHELRWPARPMIPEGKSKGRYKNTYFLLDVKPDENLMLYQNKDGDMIRLTLKS